MKKKYTFIIYSLKILVAFLLFTSSFLGWGQVNVFNRSDSNTGDWDSTNNPWFYDEPGNNYNYKNPDNDSNIRHFVKIGHNNFTTMVTNGRFYLVNTLDFQSAATSARTINNVGGGLSASGGIYNASSATHTFNTPIGIDGTTVQIHTNSTGGFVFNQSIFINNNTVQFGNIGAGDITVNGPMEGAGNVQKIGTNTLIITGTHTYSGTTSIDSGVLKLQGNISSSAVTVKSGATLEIDADVTILSLTIDIGGTIIINANSSLTISTSLNSNGSVTLNSSSTEYPSLITNTASGEVTYNRFINSIGSTGTPGGNDLISIPVIPTAGLNFEELTLQGSPANNTKIAMNPAETLFAFGPYENSSNLTYINYLTYNGNNPPLLTDPPSLVKGKGYRAATVSGVTLLTFTGAVETGNVAIGISTPTGGSQWNLIGNPYPSYIDASLFLNPVNVDLIDASAVGIYGYNSATYTGLAQTTGNYTIINFATLSIPGETFNISPGQGFFVASGNGGNIEFTPSMRTISGDDDYIYERDTNQSNFIKLDLIGLSTYSTSIFFNTNASLGLDPGYDAAVFGENGNTFPIYSHLIEDNLGRAMAIQSLGENDLTDVTIPLGVNTNQGEAITFSINTSTLPDTVEVYLEDNATNTFTLLNSSNYTVTPNVNLYGTGRFYLRVTDGALSTSQNTLDDLSIYTNQSDKTVVIAGQLFETTTAKIYDLQGRLVNTSILQTTNRLQTIDISDFSTGVYVIQLVNASKKKIQKVIIR